MFSGLFGQLAGDVRHEEDEAEDAAAPSSAPSSGAEAGLGLDNIWGLADVMSRTVRAHTQELVKSVAQTDWKAELMAFSKEAAEEGKHISHRTAELVEHLPEHFPERSARSASNKSREASQSGSTFNDVGGSLKTFGTSLLLGTKEFFDQVRDAVEGEIATAAKEARRSARAARASGGPAASKLGNLAPAAKYNRFEADVAAMQRDSSTYCDEPADAEDFARWQESFSLEAAQGQVNDILAENSFMAELHTRIVPVIVEPSDFWLRYFYRLHKLQLKEDARQALAQRAKEMNAQEEELGWDDLEIATPTGTTEQDKGSQKEPEPSQGAKAEDAPDAVQQATSDAPAALPPSNVLDTTTSAVTESLSAPATAPTKPADQPATQAAPAAEPASAPCGERAAADPVVDGSPKGSDMVSVPDDNSTAHETGSDGSRGDWFVVGESVKGDDQHTAARVAAVARRAGVSIGSGHQGSSGGGSNVSSGGGAASDSTAKKTMSTTQDKGLVSEPVGTSMDACSASSPAEVLPPSTAEAASPESMPVQANHNPNTTQTATPTTQGPAVEQPPSPAKTSPSAPLQASKQQQQQQQPGSGISTGVAAAVAAAATAALSPGNTEATVTDAKPSKAGDGEEEEDEAWGDWD